jgi:hypothetical protein
MCPPPTTRSFILCPWGNHKLRVKIRDINVPLSHHTFNYSMSLGESQEVMGIGQAMYPHLFPQAGGDGRFTVGAGAPAWGRPAGDGARFVMKYVPYLARVLWHRNTAETGGPPPPTILSLISKQAASSPAPL